MRSGRPDCRSLLHRLGFLAGALALLAGPRSAQALAPPVLRFLPRQSKASFSVQLIWFQTVSGQFPDVRGGVRIDPSDGTVHVQARIRVQSVRVHPSHYRQRLLGTRFFDAARYPFIRFVSAPLPMQALRHGHHLHGRLTLHGITRPLTLHVSGTQCPGPGLAGCLLHLEGWVDRTRFGMYAYRTFVHQRVRLDLAIRLGTPAAATGGSTPDISSR